ncbi:hypothetical protein GE09DRAFT_481880 [Coniochaeta sp. 2T2.1]|nr:hypothetical protein GE09DRAFT_481880 [Coniochaeta sp. 2T2.1]
MKLLGPLLEILNNTHLGTMLIIIHPQPDTHTSGSAVPPTKTGVPMYILSCNFILLAANGHFNFSKTSLGLSSAVQSRMLLSVAITILALLSWLICARAFLVPTRSLLQQGPFSASMPPNAALGSALDGPKLKLRAPLPLHIEKFHLYHQSSGHFIPHRQVPDHCETKTTTGTFTSSAARLFSTSVP